jgi:hypothetical protein
MALLGTSTLADAGGSAHASPQRAPCSVTARSQTFQTQQGVRIDGHCPGSTAPGGDPASKFRMVGCAADHQAFSEGRALAGVTCAEVHGCKLLTEGAQSGRYFLYSYEQQEREPGATAWVAVRDWCPQAGGVPGAGAVRDRVVKLLPVVAARSTDAATLVNIQTIVWADTPIRRSLGRVRVAGQPVWVRLVFARARWEFGDGDADTTATPGKVYDPDTDACASVMCPDYYGHVYRTTGVMTVRVRVAWRASYSLDGTHFQPVDPAPLTGPPATLRIHVRQARAVLVPNPGGH